MSDSHEGYYNNRPVPIWQMNDRYEQAVIERLSDRFGDTPENALEETLIQTDINAVEDNLTDYLSQFKDFTQDSFLEELDDLDASEYFDIEDFADIINYNTPNTLGAIGITTSDISEGFKGNLLCY